MRLSRNIKFSIEQSHQHQQSKASENIWPCVTLVKVRKQRQQNFEFFVWQCNDAARKEFILVKRRNYSLRSMLWFFILFSLCFTYNYFNIKYFINLFILIKVFHLDLFFTLIKVFLLDLLFTLIKVFSLFLLLWTDDVNSGFTVGILTSCDSRGRLITYVRFCGVDLSHVDFSLLNNVLWMLPIQFR